MVQSWKITGEFKVIEGYRERCMINTENDFQINNLMFKFYSYFSSS